MASIPSTMRSLAVRQYGKPSTYEVLTVPVPRITEVDDVLIRVHAANIMTGDTQIADGAFRFFAKVPFPVRLSQVGAGVVTAIGSGVKSVKVGDEVYGLTFSRPIFPIKEYGGWCSDYTVSAERFLVIKPPHLSFAAAASLIGPVITGYQCFKRGMELRGEPGGNLEGKTVFVPGALSATGSAGVQIAKNVFRATRVISTVSTPKMKQVETYLPEVVDELIDYKTQDHIKEIGKGTVDLVYNTQWEITKSFQLAEPNRGVVMTIASAPQKQLLRAVVGDALPFWVGWILDIMNLYYVWLLSGTNVKYEFISGNPGVREDVEMAGEIIARRQVLPVFTEVDIDDIEAVREECGKVATGKGGLGGLVVKLV